jgi:hypothetical protein
MREGLTVSGTWSIDRYPVVGSYNEEVLVTVRFGQFGTLEFLSVYLVEFDRKDERVDLISVPNALSYLRAEGYPKDAFLEPVPGSAEECSTEGCVDYDLAGLEGFDEVAINSSQIVYLYSQYGSTDVLPLYQFRGDAVVPLDDGSSTTMYATLYVNAIDPAQVIVPSE